jgi:hypothetical protein
VYGDGFGTTKASLFATNPLTGKRDGVQHIVDVRAGGNTYTAKNYGTGTWSNTYFKFQFAYFYIDKEKDYPVGGTGPYNCSGTGQTGATSEPWVDANKNGHFDWDDYNLNGFHDAGETPLESWTDTGVEGLGIGDGLFTRLTPARRNFYRDADEPEITYCGCLDEGTWSVYVKSIYYRDDNKNGYLDSCDFIYQIEVSDPAFYDLTLEPNIFKLNPWSSEPAGLLRIYGANFGTSKGTVHYKTQGGEIIYGPPALGGTDEWKVKFWSNTLIKVYVPNWGCAFFWKDPRWAQVWITKHSGDVSNSKWLKIVKPVSCYP